MYRFIDNRTLAYPESIAYWKDYLTNLDMNRIKYLEIGSLHGGSLLTFHNMFGPNVESTCIDQFSNCDYNEHEQNYEIFKMNTKQLGNKNVHLRMPSYEILPLLQKDYFDVIYIDGNHYLSSILEDAVLCYRKLKSNGYLIMDDINWGGPGEANTQSTVNSFVNAYTKHKMDLIYISENQLILRQK